MAEKSMFFHSMEDDIREYSASDMADCLSGICPNGVLEGLEVTQRSGMMVVSAGKAIINGYIFCMDTEKTFNIPVSDTQRLDRIILQLDLSERKISIVYKTGTSSVAPALTQNSEIYEIALSVMRVPANAAVATSNTREAIYARDYKNLQNKPIYYGTGTPSNVNGNDGDIYIQYEVSQ